ncbi:MAG: DUF3794 domain-containing protein [Lachnospiraceae bacterium]|nr:DUF3794 domain-containing protein [Lachnospiraceae bacterium]
MNRQKGKAISQITLDDDYNIPDNMPDAGMVIQEKGSIEIGEVKAENGRVKVKGSLRFFVLYMDDTPENGLHSIQGQLPFEEMMNVEDAKDGDSLQLKWMLEDLSAALVNSRKLSIKTVVTLELEVEELFDEEIPVAVEGPDTVQVKTCHLSTAGLTAQKKDTCRIKDEIILPANKPNIREVLWQDVTMQGTELRLSEGEVLIKGELVVFILYEGEEENGKVYWMEQILPFNSRADVSGCHEGMLGNIGINLERSDLEVKPDYDGELRVLNIDAVLELDIQIYEEEHLSMICDLYSPTKELELITSPAVYETLLVCNASKCRVTDRMKTGNTEVQILQICHSRGEVKVDESTVTEDGVLVEGIVSVQVLYVTSDDNHPFLCLKGIVPFTHLIDVPGIGKNSVYYLQLSLEQLSVNMVNSEELEIKAVILLNALVLDRVSMQHISDVEEHPLNIEAVKALPGFLIYVVQPADTLWDIAKAYHTTTDQICNLNDLAAPEIKTGQKLLLVKQMENL